MKPSYVVWPEGKPEKARRAGNRIHREWLCFWVGLKSWPRRMCTSPYVISTAKTPMEVAQLAEIYFFKRPRK